MTEVNIIDLICVFENSRYQLDIIAASIVTVQETNHVPRGANVTSLCQTLKLYCYYIIQHVPCTYYNNMEECDYVNLTVRYHQRLLRRNQHRRYSVN